MNEPVIESFPAIEMIFVYTLSREAPAVFISPSPPFAQSLAALMATISFAQ